MYQFLKGEALQEESEISYFFSEDYCISVHGVFLRDFRGTDLTYLDWIQDNVDLDKAFSNWRFTCDFLKRFCRDQESIERLESLTLKQLYETLTLFHKIILRRRPSRDSWLKLVYYLNGMSFTGLNHYEDMPFAEIDEMRSIHIDRIEKEKEAMKN